MNRARTPKLAIFMPDLDWGGAQRANVLLANEIIKHGIDVDFVVHNASGHFTSLLADNVRLVVLGGRWLEAGLPRLCRYLVREGPDVLMASMQFASVMALVAKKIAAKRCRVVVQCQTMMSAEYTELDLGPAARLWIQAFGALLPSADAIVAVSRAATEDVVRMFPKTSGSVHTIYNPAFDSSILELADEPVGHSWFNDPEVPVVVSVGRLAPEKDHKTLLDAFSQVLESCRARLITLGDGPERHKLLAHADKLGISRAVDFPGFVANPFSFVKNARIFVLSSICEGMPLALLEALTCGTPVVSTNCPGGVREALEGGKWGQLVPVGDAPAMAEAILKAISEPVDSAALAARGAHFSASRIALEYLDLFFPERHGTPSIA